MTSEAHLAPTSPHLAPGEVRGRPNDLAPSLAPPTGARTRSDAGRESTSKIKKDQAPGEVKEHPYRHPGTLWQPARLTTHRRCGRPILEAHADGLPVQAEPWVLTAAGELAAALAGNRILLNVHFDADLLISFRQAYHVGWTHLQPLVQHSCDIPVGEVDAELSAVLVGLLLDSKKENAECDF